MRYLFVLLFFSFLSPSTTLQAQPSASIDTLFDASYDRAYEKKMVARMNRGIGRFFDRFNLRKAMPLKASVYSVIVPQHRQIVRWLQSRDHVADDRIGFYGKSWGGRSALRLPALIDDYALSISSAYFNMWPLKAMSTDHQNTYMRTSSIGIYVFNQGNTFGHAELANLVAPRPFMVESGLQDGVARHAWVGYEFGKVKRLYTLLGVEERAQLGFFVGGHEIDAATTFPFLHKYLDHPAPDASLP